MEDGDEEDVVGLEEGGVDEGLLEGSKRFMCSFFPAEGCWALDVYMEEMYKEQGSKERMEQG